MHPQRTNNLVDIIETGTCLMREEWRDRELDNAAINIIPDYPPHGVYRGQHRGFSNISLQILPQERGISSFSGTERLKKHTNTLIIAT